MNLLLDTHTFLYYVNSSSLLSDPARDAIADPANKIYLSVVSAWEIAIKSSLNKLQIPKPVEIFIPEQLWLNDFQLLSIKINHLGVVAQFPFHHRDPFDRLLAAQSIAENFPLISIDGKLDAYGVSRIW